MGEFKSCPVCNEQSDQCLSCASYVIDGERIYYEKLKDFGATQDHEVRFINRIQKQRTTAFFHNGKLYIPSRQGRVVPLAIGLQWEAWMEQQSKIEGLENLLSIQRHRAKALEVELTNSRNYSDKLHEKVEGLEKQINRFEKLLAEWKSQGAKGSSDYAIGGLHARQDCEDALEKALRGES